MATSLPRQLATNTSARPSPVRSAAVDFVGPAAIWYSPAVPNEPSPQAAAYRVQYPQSRAKTWALDRRSLLGKQAQLLPHGPMPVDLHGAVLEVETLVWTSRIITDAHRAGPFSVQAAPNDPQQGGAHAPALRLSKNVNGLKLRVRAVPWVGCGLTGLSISCGSISRQQPRRRQ